MRLTLFSPSLVAVFIAAVAVGDLEKDRDSRAKSVNIARGVSVFITAMAKYLVPVVFFVVSQSACVPRTPSRAWSEERAATYLDHRAETWLAWSSAKRGSGENQTTCLCCHTVVPYAMARPLLSAASSAPTTLTTQTRLRVQNFQRLDSPAFQLMYDFNERVKKESIGTEAVLNAVVLAFDDRHQRRREPSAATAKAFANLWSTQAADGAWDWLSPEFELEPWESSGARYFGAAMALLAVGVAPGVPADTPQLQKARAYLQKHYAAQNTHNQLWALWAAAEAGVTVSDEQRSSAIASIRARQRADGGWSLSSLGKFPRAQNTSSDGYATGLIVHVLQRSNVAAESASRGRTWLRKNQTSTGAWRAYSLNKPRDPSTHRGKFMSDAATAFAVLALRSSSDNVSP